MRVGVCACMLVCIYINTHINQTSNMHLIYIYRCMIVYMCIRIYIGALFVVKQEGENVA